MNKLKHIEINIWKACNNKCIFCMSSDSHSWDIKFVKLDLIKNTLSKYYLDWYNSVWFLWWDISIHPNIIEILEYSKKIWFENINVISNWMKFSDFTFAKKITDAWITRINISIHSHLKEIEDNLTWVKWWLIKKIKAIDNFNNLYENNILKSPISINMVLNKINLPTIVESVLYFNKIKKINDIRINFVWLEESVKHNWDLLKISYTEFLPYLKQLIYISLKYDIRITFDTVPACIFYKIDNINYKILIKKFLWEDLDHISEIDHINASDKFNWKEKKKNILKTQFKWCLKCIYKKSCQWVRKEYAKLFWWEEFESIFIK